jgi:hypothetical protein
VGRFGRVLELSGEEDSGDIVSDSPINESMGALEQVMIKSNDGSSVINSCASKQGGFTIIKY